MSPFLQKVWLVELKIQNLSLLLNWLQGFEAVVQCVEKLVELMGSFELGLGMNTPTRLYRDQILGMDHP
jgi:hypothetical protein